MNLLPRSAIQIRDPFVVPQPNLGRYVLTGSTDKNIWGGPGVGFDAYISRDLENFEGPYPIFRPPTGFWSDTQFWAPEIHAWKGRWYLFATFASSQGRGRRGTQILVADDILGPYLPHSDGPVTPRDWECLDGTLVADETGAPWIVFCHEWLQCGNGGMMARRLTDDLQAPLGEAVELFRAQGIPWVRDLPNPFRERDSYVTDGPFFHRTTQGALLMLWSSFGEHGYTCGLARSSSGKLLGPWTQDAEPIFGKDGGHAMIFRDLQGGLRLALHQPNDTPNERPFFLPLQETARGLSLV